MSESKTTGVSRRSILKTFGAGAAALATTPIITKADAIKQAALSQTNAVKTGIIIPGSVAKTNSTAFLNGIDLFLATYKQDHGNVPFSPIIETANGGFASYKAALGKLTQHHEIKAVVAYANSHISGQLSSVIDELELPFIDANVGENFFSTNSKYCFHSSLNLWQSHYLLGKYAAEHSGKQAITVGSFYDCAYDAHYAFEAGFVAGGGTIVKQIITGSPADHFSPIEAASIAATTEASVVFLNYSGNDASVFMSALQRHEGITTKSLYGNSTLASMAAITTVSNGVSADNPIAALYKQSYGSRMNDLAVLGYQTAALLTAALSKAGSNPSGLQVATALSEAVFDSPLGSVSMNVATHTSETPIAIRSSGGSIISREPIPSSLTFNEYRLTEKIRSGAINVYPFIS